MIHPSVQVVRTIIWQRMLALTVIRAADKVKNGQKLDPHT